MTWINRLLRKKMNVLKHKSETDIRLLPINTISPLYSDEGIIYFFPDLSEHAISSTSLTEWALASEFGGQAPLYLAQLVDEGIAIVREDSFLLSWSDIYYLQASEDHSDSIELISLPKIKKSILNLVERYTLSDPNFSVVINGYIDPQGRLIQVDQKGAIFSKGSDVWMVSAVEWGLISTINDFKKHITSQELSETTQKDRESHWGKIRIAALNAGARLSPYLASVIVITPENLIINYSRQEAIGMGIVVIEPIFNNAPEEWLTKFDELNSVPKHIDFTSEDGRVRIIFSDPVHSVLQTIKKDFPGRRAGGAKAEAFVRNPFAYLGDDASKVIDPSQIENAKEQAGIVPTRFILLNPNIKNGCIKEVVGLIQQVFESGAGKTVEEKISSPTELNEIISIITAGCAEERQFFQWRNHVVDIDGDIGYQLDQATRFLNVWQAQIDSFIDFEDIYTFNDYYARVAGIGIAKPIYSPYIQKKDGDNTPWAPEHLSPFVNVQLTPDGLPTFIPLDLDWIDDFKNKIVQAKVLGQPNILDSRLPFPISIEEAEPLLAEFNNLLNAENPSSCVDSLDVKVKNGSNKQAAKKPMIKESLLIKANVSQLDYSETKQIKERENRLRTPKNYSPSIPFCLREGIALMPHQLDGVAWLQHLISCAPQDCRGALLADDMGLGKTLQLLTVLAEHYEKNPTAAPSLIAAPPALMKNWINEAATFFNNFPTILLLHGEGLTERRQPRALIDQELLNKKISNLLIPNWLGSAKIVLTTYEAVRDYEFSLAKQNFTFLICDEAQKIKTPNALVTLALKKQKADFRIACTGTPVENNLADIWCLYDFIQPGLLGDLNEFGKKYRHPIETKTDGQADALDLLRKLIELQMLRRMKEDIAENLPKKIKVSNDVYEFEGKNRERLSIQISDYQRGLYEQGIIQLRSASGEVDAKKRATLSFGVLHFIKAVCAEPYCRPRTTFGMDPRGHTTHLFNSPKLKWTLEQLAKIAPNHEKVIIFTELREVQRALIQFIHHKFNFTPLVINGSTDERQELIDQFQKKPGFGVIVLSPLAVGFGVNIVSANHVIHYSRTWNPAKEGQATDRAYRIGQKKDVFVYCPTIIANDFVTFEDKLDRLMSTKMDLAGDMLDGVGADISCGELLPSDGPSGLRTNVDDLVDMNIVDGLDWRGFEIFCKILFGQSFGLASLTADSGDGGVDLVVISEEESIGMLCQCKHTSQATLGWDAIKEIYAGSPAYEAQHPGVIFKRVAICNKKFNEAAKKQATRLRVYLIERDEISQILTNKPIKRTVLDAEIFQHC